MKNSTRASKKAAKARLSGAISSDVPKNKKIVFGEDDNDSLEGDMEMDTHDNDNAEEQNKLQDEKDITNNDSNEEDAVEEVKGSAARESTQRLREAERKMAKETITKKKRKKKVDDVIPEIEADHDNHSDSEEDEEEDDLFTDDFFKMVDTERTDQLQKAKQEKRQKKLQKKKMLGKHTTFVVEDEYTMTNTPHQTDQNIEVVALGDRGKANESKNTLDEERQILLSATLGSAPSKAAVAFARGSMSGGASKERSSESRKRKTKNEDTWKRSRRVNRFGSKPGQAAALFVRRK